MIFRSRIFGAAMFAGGLFGSPAAPTSPILTIAAGDLQLTPDDGRVFLTPDDGRTWLTPDA